MNHPLDTVDLSQRFAEACARVPVAQGPAALAKELARIAPHYAFREVLARGGWYRLGGVIDNQGRHVADDIERWVADELARHDDDLAAVAAAHAEKRLRATRLIGKTHYWVARTGSGAADFVQVEIEELQEVAYHTLFADGEVPASTEELVDPRAGCTGHPMALGMPFYQLRRVTAIADHLAAMRAQKPEPQPIHRFITDWERSSAAHASDFSNHWVIAVREHLDRYRQTIKSAIPVAAINGAPPRFESSYGARGLSLASALQQFDKQIGYPMAWFFHLLTTKAVPHAVATAVVEDMKEDFCYLPDRDMQVVRGWLHNPYNF
ncbi:hypothetical protein GWK36_11860 [Caldichromatium japonicum]|uniref:Uncharacterized protein n=1 Tax=Caldichromatium japonicum TaxID=2699430 RepID=A0A6G7VEW2_9GAMM|nr:hypothetical protein [Caldichromatium japonicum]QIK38561.1 hypothetical protein GWK36_11860 [Caldichromatium japonicum]